MTLRRNRSSVKRICKGHEAHFDSRVWSTSDHCYGNYADDAYVSSEKHIYLNDQKRPVTFNSAACALHDVHTETVSSDNVTCARRRCASPEHEAVPVAITTLCIASFLRLHLAVDAHPVDRRHCTHYRPPRCRRPAASLSSGSSCAGRR